MSLTLWIHFLKNDFNLFDSFFQITRQNAPLINNLFDLIYTYKLLI